MKRRGFLASLIVAPAAAKVMAEAKPIEVPKVQLMTTSPNSHVYSLTSAPDNWDNYLLTDIEDR